MSNEGQAACSLAACVAGELVSTIHCVDVWYVGIHACMIVARHHVAAMANTKNSCTPVELVVHLAGLLAHFFDHYLCMT